MKTTIIRKIKLKPTKSDIVALNYTMSQYTSACNYISKYIFDTKETDSYEVQKVLYNEVKTNYKLLSQMTCSALKTVCARYKSLLSAKQEWTLCEFKKNQCELVWNRDYTLKKDYFAISTLSGRIKIPFVMKGNEKYFDNTIYKFGTAKIIQRGKDFYLYIPVTFNVDSIKVSDNTVVVGIDRGINFIAVTYDSNGKSKFYNGKNVTKKREHFKQLRSELQKKGTPSARKRLKSIGHRENRWMSDVNHCLSKALVNQYPSGTLFVLEDLKNVREATKKVKKEKRYVQVSWSYYDLEQKLTYKAQMKSSKVIKVNAANTSKTCPKCNHKNDANRDKKNHKFCCKSCGYKSNDDRIGAMNIYARGLKYKTKCIENIEKSTTLPTGAQSTVPDITLIESN